MSKFFYPLFVFTILLITSFSCSNSSDRSRKPVSSITVEPNKKSYAFNENVSVSVNTNVKNGEIGNIQLYYNNQLIKETRELNFTVKNFKLNELGNAVIKVVATKTDGVSNTKTKPLLVVSDVIPENYTYQVIKVLPHQKSFYTQGLEFYNGFFYEGTGGYGKSGIYKTNVLTGNSIQSAKIENEFFGEGITVLNNKIYQLTWKNKKGFVYNLSDFALIDSFSIPFNEGWGLTNNGKDLIMSDGSNFLYWVDPITFKVIKIVQVANHKDIMNNLNELEYIEGLIYSNVYTTDLIVVIEPETGKITKEIKLNGLIDKYRNLSDSTEVLNGIAYDKINQKLYVTGKYWARLFEIKTLPLK